MCENNHHHSLSLEQLEGAAWPDPGPSTRLVLECHRLRKIALEQLTIEDLRLLLGQKIGATHLAPLALEQLELDPWAGGDCYKGDLLVAILRTESAFWVAHTELRQRLDAVVLNAQYELQNKQEVFQQQILPTWQRIYGGS